MLHLPEFFVLERHGLGGKLCVRLEHPFAVEPGIFLDLGHINGHAFPLHLEVLPVALVSNQAFGSLLELFFQGFYDRFPIESLFSRLAGVNADDAAVVSHPHLFYFERRRVLAGLSFGMDLPVSSGPGEHLFLDFFNVSHPGSQDVGNFVPAAIVDITTKTGQDLNGGLLSAYGGQYETALTDLEYGGTCGPFRGYALFSFMQDSLGMANPTASFRPIHDDTDQFKGFADVSYLIDSTSRLTLIMSGADSTFQLPVNGGQVPHYQYGAITTFDSSKVNDNQYELANYEILGYQKNLGNIDLQLTQSTRVSDVSFKPDTVADVIFNGIASDTDHQLISNNLNCDVSDRINDQHTVRSGLSFSFYQAQVNTTDTVLPAAWNGSQWVATPGGLPFNIVNNDAKMAELYGVYLQDEWRITPKLTVNYGVRADLWTAYINESQISPRVNFVYKLLQATTLHAGYGRYFTPPPLELVQTADVSKFNNTTDAVDPSLRSTTADPVRSERYHYLDAGVNQDITHNLHVGVDAYYKIKTNVLDEGQFGPAMIFSPNNAAKGLVRGVELTVSYEKNGFTLWGNVARSQATVEGITSGQWQFTPEEVAYMNSHWYHLDHDQNWTASAGSSYKWGHFKVYADALYGSGLYSGFCNETELPGYVTVNLGMTYDLKLSPGNNLKFRFDIINVGDLSYEIRNGTGIGVFAPQYLPRRAFYAGVSKNF